MDSLTLAISQGSLRRGSAACYLQIDHPEIEEFIEMRRPTVEMLIEDLKSSSRCLVSDDFMRAVETDSQWALRVQMTDLFSRHYLQEIYGLDC